MKRADLEGLRLAEEIAELLTTPARTITAATVRKWAWRSRRRGDKLQGRLPGIQVPGERTGNTYYRIEDAAVVAKLTKRGVTSGNTAQ